MTWLTSLFSALLTGLLGMLVSGFLAARAVDWYSISSREGGAGYFVISIGFFGLIAGGVIGLIVARIIAAGTHPEFLRATVISFGIVALLGAVGGGAARLLADVPPELDGETLMLALEVRWPPGEQPGAPGSTEPSVTLHSIPRFSHTVRVSESGPLWVEDARQVEGRWVVPGAVRLFTSRGKRMLTVNTGEDRLQGFDVPLPGWPGKPYLEWSDWLPKFRAGVEVPANLLSYRFRLIRSSEPLRSQTIGAFDISTTAAWFTQEVHDSVNRHVASASFGFRYRGQPLVIEGRTSLTEDATGRIEHADDVALVDGPRPAFLIHVDREGSSGFNYLLVDEGERVRVDLVAEWSSGMKGRLLTSDSAEFRRGTRAEAIRGRIDRVSYATPGLYLFGHTVVDTRQQRVHYFAPDSQAYGIPSVPPLALSPDGRSFVEFGNVSGTNPPPLLLVTDFVGDTTYTLPIDPARMRYATFASLDPAWVAHHFEWQRDGNGIDRLRERKQFVPLPYQGELATDNEGSTSYRMEKGSEGLRTALTEFLVREFKAVSQPSDSGAYEKPVLINGDTVNIALSGDFGYVMVSLARGGKDSTLIAAIGQRFNTELKTGRYDDLLSPRQ